MALGLLLAVAAMGSSKGSEETALADPFPGDCDDTVVPSEVEDALLASVLSDEPPAPVVSSYGLLLDGRWRCPPGERAIQAVAKHRAVDVAAAWANRNEAMLEVAVSLEGLTPRLLLTRAELLGGIERAAALELAHRRLLARGEPVPPELGSRRVAALLDSGQTRLALAVASELGVDPLSDTVNDAEPRVPRLLDAAAAAVLEGRADLARSYLASFGPRRPEAPAERPAGASWKERRRVEIDATSALLGRAIELAVQGDGTAAEDPFELLAELALRVDDLYPRCTLLLFLGELSDRFGYPSFASYFRRRVGRIIRSARQTLQRPESELMEALGAPIRSLLAELAPFAGPPLDVAPAGPGEASPKESVPAGFRVRPLDPGELAEPGPRPSPLEAPKGFGVVRSERSGGLDVVLATSQALDPVGELSSGGYWILSSSDGGASWEAWPTGLRVGFPYRAVGRSRCPLLTEEGLAIEVRWARIDESSITFPPVALEIERHEEPLVIEIPWSVLRADQDGDRLSDLFEERLLTDPERADTDGDGIGDLHDSLPGVPHTADPGPAAEALNALLRALGDEEQQAILPRCSGGEGELCFGSTSPGFERVRFVIGDPSDWAGIVPMRRTVVLTPEAHVRAEARWGPVYATRYPLLAVDRAGGRAVIVWSRSWQGGTARLERTEEGWAVEIRSSWIT